MASIFHGLNVGYSGLNAAQVGINTTGHNISNAETEGYTRQRVVTAAAYPLTKTPGAWGAGASITEITRVFDSFVFNRYTATSQSKEYSDYMRETLEELSTYFPEIDAVGIKSDMQAYFDLWQSMVDNPDNNAVKIALAQQAQTMSEHIHHTREQVRTLQAQVNEQLAVSIDEVNRLASEIADLTRAINDIESGGIDHANDLRDQRNVLELALSKLVDATIFEGKISSDMPVDSHIAVRTGDYAISVGGFNLVDGVTFHPIGVTDAYNAEGFHDLYYERQDGYKIPFADKIQGGKVGAILDLRGSILDEQSGIPQDGILQETLNQLDAFAQSLIESTNNVYAQSATDYMQSNAVNVVEDVQLLDYTNLNLRAGSFDMVVYDVDGNALATRTIYIDDQTVLKNAVLPNQAKDGFGNLLFDAAGNPIENSIIGQLSAAVDDNADNNALNDINALITADYVNGEMIIRIDPAFQGQGYSFAVNDNLPDGFGSGTNFAGAMGLHRFFDGENGKDITLHSEFKSDPTKIQAHKEHVLGNNGVALDMVQMQFEKIGFTVGQVEYRDSVYGFFDTVATEVGSKTNSAILTNETLTAQFNAIEMQYSSISKVSIDEEMTNLIKYQTAYGAAAKVITTIDQMMTTLLGLKQ